MKVKISRASYDRIKKLATTEPKYKGKGIIGVIDDAFVGEFTTCGSGRPAKNSLGTAKK